MIDKPRDVVVIAPHSDDETIAAFSLMQRWQRGGTVVRVVVVTDGAASHRNSGKWPKPRLIAERRLETLRAMRSIGIPQQRVRLLGFPDGGLDSLSATERRRLVRALRHGREPDLVVIPSAYDSHPDHRDVASACREAWPPRVARLAYTVWPGSRGEPRSGAAATDIVASPFRKRRTLGLYRTQTGLIRDDPNGFHLTASQIAEKCGPFEQFQRG